MRRPSLVRAAAWIVALALVAAALWALRGQWSAVGAIARGLRPRWTPIASSCLLVLLGYGILAESWRRVLATMGARLSFGAATQMWFVSSLARYIPGALWQIGALGAMAQQRGISPVAVAGSAILMTVVNVLTGAVLVATLAGAQLLGGRGWLFVALGVVGLALVPVITPRLANVIARLRGNAVTLPTFGPGAVWIAAVGNVLAWGAYGAGFWLLAHGTVGAHDDLAAYTAAYVLSYLAGFLSLGPPSGIGVAEPAMVAAFAALGVGTNAEATVLAGIARLWRTILEIVPGILFLLAGAARLAGPSRSQTTS